MRVCTRVMNRRLWFVGEVVVVVNVEVEVEVEYGNRKRMDRDEDPVHQACNQQSSHRTQILPQETPLLG
jgi:hypothetical protein